MPPSIPPKGGRKEREENNKIRNEKQNNIGNKNSPERAAYNSPGQRPGSWKPEFTRPVVPIVIGTNTDVEERKENNRIRNKE